LETCAAEKNGLSYTRALSAKQNGKVVPERLREATRGGYVPCSEQGERAESGARVRRGSAEPAIEGGSFPRFAQRAGELEL
jgi:hypothetical protein